MKKGKLIVFEGLSGSGKTTQANRLYDFFRINGIPVVLNTEPTKNDKNNPFGRMIRNIIESQPISLKTLQREFLPSISVLLRELSKPVFQRTASQEYSRTIARFSLILNNIFQKLSAKVPVSLDELERQAIFIADRYFDLKNTLQPTVGNGINVIEDRYELSTIAYGTAQGLSMRELKNLSAHVLKKFYLKPHITFFIDVKPETAVRRLAASGKTIDRYETLDNLKRIKKQYARAIEFFGRRPGLVAHINGEKKEEKVFTAVIKVLKEKNII